MQAARMTMERKTAPLSFALKAIGDQGEIEGYALTYGNVDQGGDICLKGCATNSLRKRPAAKVKMLLSHDPSTIIGKWTDFIDDDKGLFGKGRLFLNIQSGRETYELLKEEAIDGLSIGYRTLKDAYDSDRNARLLEEIDIREVSVVPFPMNEQATISLVKAGTIPSEREFEAWLQSPEVGFTKWQAKAIIADGYRAVCKAERDAGAGSNNLRYAERDAGTDGANGLLEAIRGLRQSLA